MFPSLTHAHRPALADLLAAISEFRPDEVAVALELADAALARPDEPYAYEVRVAAGHGHAATVDGFVCFGPTPMTSGTYDLYWLAVHPRARGRGLARSLVEHFEATIRARGARLVRIETASLDSYEGTHRFYERAGFACTARIRDFYAQGNDLCTYTKYL